jgi:EAL domain-containing protein (putative c-di-GMP-specific phosphodiesterase class I)
MDELRYAIRSNELVACYQPKVDIKTGAVKELEALVRWKHKVHGLMSPDKFIPLAEQTGLIKPLTLWILHESLMQCTKWSNEGYKLRVAVNLSTSDLLDAKFPDTVARALKTHNVLPEKLLIEITESAVMMDTARAMEILNRLANMGVRLSIDDYGTGDSSLSYLSKLPLKELKIDKSFVMDIGSNNNAQIVQSTIDLGHNLGLEVVAEGVENAWILSLLQPLGCDTAQGYYFSRPRDAQEFTTWIGQAIATGRMQNKGGQLYMMLPQRE